MTTFSKRKFLSLTIVQQHKHAAALLKEAYQTNPPEVGEVYRRIEKWLNLPALNAETRHVADRYHWHLAQGGVRIKEANFLPALRTGDRAKPLQPPLPICVYLDQLRSAHNVGSILRTVESLQLGEVCFSGQTPFVDQKPVQDTSMGTHAWVPCRQGALSECPRPVIALETSPDAIPLSQFIFPSTFTLAVGNEEYGCSEATLRSADALIEIPLAGRKNSLNVANAFAIVAYEVRRQLQKDHL